MADSWAYCIRVFVVLDPEEGIWMVVGSNLVAVGSFPYSICFCINLGA